MLYKTNIRKGRGTCSIPGKHVALLACSKNITLHNILLINYVFTGAVKRNPRTSSSTLKEVDTAIASWLHGTRDRAVGV